MSSLADIIDQAIAAGLPFTSAEVVARSGRTRQAVSRHLARHVAEGRLVASGRGRATRYHPSPPTMAFDALLPLAGMAEDQVWTDVRRHLPELDDPAHANAASVVGYAFTELLNNAIDHAAASAVRVRLWRAGESVCFDLEDDGLGVYENIRQQLALPDLLAALQELSKGKLTTQPDRHTGAGLFFSSKVADRFELAANGLVWLVDNVRADMAIGERAVPRLGTHARFEVGRRTETSLEAVFARYTHDLEFDTTRTVVKLFAHGVRFVSRSEAKRLVHGLDRFAHVVMDFAGVEAVGQGFADEVFRVWHRSQPTITLVAEHMNPAVAFMVNRARARAAADG